jgi:hypothetical protein
VERHPTVDIFRRLQLKFGALRPISNDIKDDIQSLVYKSLGDFYYAANPLPLIHLSDEY